jgi:hypothetical protein
MFSSSPNAASEICAGVITASSANGTDCFYRLINRNQITSSGNQRIGGYGIANVSRSTTYETPERDWGTEQDLVRESTQSFGMGLFRVLYLPGCDGMSALQRLSISDQAKLTIFAWQAILNLIFGSALSSGSGRSTPTDVTSAILSRVAEALGLDIDVHTWSKAVGLVLTGSIILVNINAVLGYVSRAFRATSAGVSASFMLLFLSQLMASSTVMHEYQESS